jgi:hypothetical protein
MLPEADYGPTLTLEPFSDLTVSSDVAFDLGYPPFASVGEEVRQAVTAPTFDFFRVAVPHVTVYKHSKPTRPNYEVGTARQITGVETVSQTSRVEHSTEAQFGLGVLVADRSHHPAGDGRIARA